MNYLTVLSLIYHAYEMKSVGRFDWLSEERCHMGEPCMCKQWRSFHREMMLRGVMAQESCPERADTFQCAAWAPTDPPLWGILPHATSFLPWDSPRSLHMIWGRTKEGGTRGGFQGALHADSGQDNK